AVLLDHLLPAARERDRSAPARRCPAGGDQRRALRSEPARNAESGLPRKRAQAEGGGPAQEGADVHPDPHGHLRGRRDSWPGRARSLGALTRRTRVLVSRAPALAAIVLAIGRVAAAQTCPPDCLGGGRNPAVDCLVEFGGLQTTDESCFDGNPSCDRDGTVDGVCTFGLSVCLNVAGDAACTPGGMTKPPSV